MTKARYEGALNLYTRKVDDKLLRQKVRDLEGRFLQGNAAVLRANQASIAWLGERAARNLEQQIQRGPDRRNHPRLADVVRDPRSSWANVDGFQFLVGDRIAAVSLRAAAYYRAIEYGSHHMEGREMVLLFYGRPGSGGQAAYGRLPGAVGRSGRAFPTVIIGRPIPAYRYADMAVETFLKARMYERFINAELRAVGLK